MNNEIEQKFWESDTTFIEEGKLIKYYYDRFRNEILNQANTIQQERNNKNNCVTVKYLTGVNQVFQATYNTARSIKLKEQYSEFNSVHILAIVLYNIARIKPINIVIIPKNFNGNSDKIGIRDVNIGVGLGFILGELNILIKNNKQLSQNYKMSLTKTLYQENLNEVTIIELFLLYTELLYKKI